MNLKLLSSNIILLLNEILSNQTICKYLHYNQSSPLSENDVEPYDLLFQKIFPFPFAKEATTEVGTQLRVYCPEVLFKNGQVVEDNLIFFDIILSAKQEIWLVNDGEPKIRPYEIASELVSFLSNRSIDTLGTIRFRKMGYVQVNDSFSCIRLIADVMTLGDKARGSYV